ncbi:MAG TPA: PolC-type DNA polymerase III N-terminal domain-containing protein, partial [Bacillales bacterium]|nr:PolC-type DNA polymerase III N-terminal domain-containing protein [Bacillales bacterium]
MNGDEQAKRRNFEILLEQIKAPEEMKASFFSEALLDKLIINTETRTWQFRIRLAEPLPFEVYQWFSSRLQETFANIAPVSFSLATNSKTLQENLVREYWQTGIEGLSNLSESMMSLLKEQVPKIDGSQLILTVRNETEAAVFKRKLSETLSLRFADMGFPSFSIETVVEHSEVE